jgi:hypothetical protein
MYIVHVLYEDLIIQHPLQSSIFSAVNVQFGELKSHDCTTFYAIVCKWYYISRSQYTDNYSNMQNYELNIYTQSVQWENFADRNFDKSLKKVVRIYFTLLYFCESGLLCAPFH